MIPDNITDGIRVDVEALVDEDAPESSGLPPGASGGTDDIRGVLRTGSQGHRVPNRLVRGTGPEELDGSAIHVVEAAAGSAQHLSASSTTRFARNVRR